MSSSSSSPSLLFPVQPIAPVIAEEEKLLRFRLRDGLTLAVPMTEIRQVCQIPRETILPIPHMADALLGICRYQQKLLSLVDLSVLLHPQLPPPPIQKDSDCTVIILEISRPSGTQSLGLFIESLQDILEVRSDQISPIQGDPLPLPLQPHIKRRCEGEGSPLWILDSVAVLTSLQI
ncbi:MAG: chemotaxis protein CheW [Cyanobacteriota bacterium]|nr:chemotaxis protein CheW [Cyanobacteriota bacterium]